MILVPYFERTVGHINLLVLNVWSDMNDITSKQKPFTAFQKFSILTLMLCACSFVWYFVRGRADTTIGLTLVANLALERDLAGHWTFDGETVGTSTILDRSGNNKHASASVGSIASSTLEYGVGATSSTTPGAYSFAVPAGVTSITVKAWGAGGGSGGSVTASVSGDGGGGGFAQSTVFVTPGETLTVYVGGGGGGAPCDDGAYGGGGGGWSGIKRSGTSLVVGGGGGGGGGAWDVYAGGSGGGGGGNSGDGQGGEGNFAGGGGGGGTQSAAGAGGLGLFPDRDGDDGDGQYGGRGGFNLGIGGIYGANGGADGGGNGDFYDAGGGGGGGGYYGGGGGGGGGDDSGAYGGGGGGSGYGAINTQASGATSANAGDSDYEGGAGQGGAGVTDSVGNDGADGRVVITYAGTYNSMPTRSAGTLGQALEFDGVDDYLDIGNAGTGIQTIAFWLKTASLTQYVIDLNGSAYVRLNAGTVTATGFTSPTIYIDGVQSTTFPADNNWHSVIITTGTGISASDMDIGRVEGLGFARGKIDDVRIYTRTLAVNDAWRFHTLGATTHLGMTLTSNLALENGLTDHWTFDAGTVSTSTVFARVGSKTGVFVAGSAPTYTTEYVYSTTTYKTAGSATWTSSSTAVSVTAHAWGGGGGGGGGVTASLGDSGSGGGGGAYSRINDFSVNGSTAYMVYVGDRGLGASVSGNYTENGYAGTDSMFYSSTTLLAKGGNGGRASSQTAGVGGSASYGYGDVKYSGGNGAGYSTSNGGGGGGSAGTDSNGNTATSRTGASAVTGGGPGGNGGAASNNNGSAPASGYGGGGGGGSEGTLGGETTGGNGYVGQVIVVQKSASSSPSGTSTTTPTYEEGAIGQGFRVRGNGEYLSFDSVGSGRKSVTFWCKTASSTQYLLDLNGSAYLWLSGGTVTAQGFTSPKVYVDGVETSTFPTDEYWHHVVVTTDTGIDANDVDLGRVEGVGVAEGVFDDLRLYDRVLTADEIVRLHALGNTTRVSGSPVGVQGEITHLWTFDGANVSGRSVYDRVGATQGSFATGTRIEYGTTTYSTAGINTWYPPLYATYVDVHLWGGGGGSSGRDGTATDYGGGGGGGGAYARSTLPVYYGHGFEVLVGAGGFEGETYMGGGGPGGPTVVGLSVVRAAGGKGGGTNFENVRPGGVGGLAGDSVGEYTASGGDGGSGTSSGGLGGGGGGAGGPNGAGNAGSNGGVPTAGQGGPGGSGNAGAGGAGGTGGNGGNGGTGGSSTYGGGGGGGGDDGARGGAAGAPGGGGGGGEGNGTTDIGRSGADGQAILVAHAYAQPQYVAGVMGQAVSVSGLGDHMDFGDIGSGIRTITFWIKLPNTKSQTILNIDGTDRIETNSSGVIVATSFPDATIYVDGVQSSALPDTDWHHVAVVDGTGVSASTFQAGKAGSTYGAFSIDDLRTYDTALSRDEIARLLAASGW